MPIGPAQIAARDEKLVRAAPSEWVEDLSNCVDDGSVERDIADFVADSKIGVIESRQQKIEPIE